jgi:hypothetical protein
VSASVGWSVVFADLDMNHTWVVLIPSILPSQTRFALLYFCWVRDDSRCTRLFVSGY